MRKNCFSFHFYTIVISINKIWMKVLTVYFNSIWFVVEINEFAINYPRHIDGKLRAQPIWADLCLTNLIGWSSFTYPVFEISETQAKCCLYWKGWTCHGSEFVYCVWGLENAEKPLYMSWAFHGENCNSILFSNIDHIIFHVELDT